ncbi:MAG TPA: thioesterase family protein [Magnetospirillaceae bacterium]|jgi:4-hydroxybenzoyl-CoA thioesterase
MPGFTTERLLRFGDCDPSGIAYYPSYFNMLNGVVEEFWQRLGFPWTEQINARRMGTPSVHFDVDFIRPSVFGDVLTFAVTIERLGRASLDLSHRISGGTELRWTAKQTLVATDLETHKARSWPDDIRAALERSMEKQ